MVFLPTALVTLLLTIFVLPKLMPDQPETETVAITGPDITNNEALSPVREFLGYGIFIATVIGLMLGLPSWAVTMAGATAVVLSGVLDEQTALIRMNMSMVLLYAGVTVMGEALSDPVISCLNVSAVPRTWAYLGVPFRSLPTNTTLCRFASS